MPKISCEIPIKTVSELNCSQHWIQKHKRHRQQKFFVKKALEHVIKQVTLPCKITLTRLAENKLDEHDNLPASMKWIVDAIAGLLKPNMEPGRADDDQRIIIAYAQRKQQKMGVLIEIEYGD